MKAIFLRIIEADDKAMALRDSIAVDVPDTRFEVETDDFAAIPRSPFAYWVSEDILTLFRSLSALREVATATVGLQSSDDFRFVALWWETPGSSGHVPFAKGGHFSPYYADVYLTVDWTDDGQEIKAFAETTPGTKHWSRNIRSAEHYFRPGLTWPRRTNGLSFRAMPAGSIFADKGPAMFVVGDEPDELLALCAIANSAPFGGLVALQLARTELAQSYEVGLIQQTPIPQLDDSARTSLVGLTRSAWALKRSLDMRTETSHAFVTPALLQLGGARLADRASAWANQLASVENELAKIRREIDEICFALYDIDGKDRRRIEEGFGAAANEASELDADESDYVPEEVEAAPLVAAMLSWSVGAVFGRFDVRLATGVRQLPTEPEPFDPLPLCSPGMLTMRDGQPVDAPPPDYPVEIPRDGILVDDVGHDRDLAAGSRRVLETVFGEDCDAVWREAAELVDAQGRDLRDWFTQSFFEYHIKRYSKSRRKAPIYWQLATPSSSYSVWLYYPRITKDTLYRVLNDYVTPKLKHEERRLIGLIQEASSNPSGDQHREIVAQESFVEELRRFQDEVARLAPLWNPNLNDGVIINFAPLWRLIPQHRTWQKECAGSWGKLRQGNYDWAHIAMHLWPERVVPKCAVDRSLAVAHGLEDVFWYEDRDRKWQPRHVEQATVEMLVKERTSAAVKDALKSLLEAPAPGIGKASKRKASRGTGARRGQVASRTSSASNRTALRSETGLAPDADLLSKVKEVIAANGEGASKADVIKATGITSGQWSIVIKVLLADGSVTQIGERRGARYHLAGGTT
ncbi:BREX-1 system adenine-specific DNA-methyltransferase PglX [Nonomuraea wenchangensis]|uniref:Uncharacterized protein n=1 Tax=Nonomuraea wenchangensis TaxID=568860 RepID=A0A1I0LWJ4_9ACTN|nr:hypothetical protein [Nonomuraea wenchangensis]SEU47607.1 hypothetical protein SAMN05421811_13016 [Nonomuraea wenchangensis]